MKGFCQRGDGCFACNVDHGFHKQYPVASSSILAALKRHESAPEILLSCQNSKRSWQPLAILATYGIYSGSRDVSKKPFAQEWRNCAPKSKSCTPRERYPEPTPHVPGNFFWGYAKLSLTARFDQPRSRTAAGG